MHLVFLYGPPAAGKYTVAKLLAAETGYALFHNHLVVDAVAAVFPFGSESFVRLREDFWMKTFEAAACEERPLIFTFQPEGSVAPDFAQRVADLVRGAGGQVTFVHLTLSREEQVARIDNADRAKFGKLRDVVLLKALQDEFATCERAMPAPDLAIDTARVPPEEAAAMIRAVL